MNLMQQLSSLTNKPTPVLEVVPKECNLNEAANIIQDLITNERNEQWIAAFLHDIGKTRIPANILNTPGLLSKEQWEKVKMHPIWGTEIFKKDAIIQKGIITHHENYDGSGYPFRLKKENIHIFGRIIAIADSIDAMTAIRSYRQPISMIQAIREVQECSGVKYDPYIVDKFVKSDKAILKGIGCPQRVLELRKIIIYT